MHYSYSFTIDTKSLPGNMVEPYKERAMIQGLRSIADMISRDYKYQECEVDARLNTPVYKIELVVLNRDQWWEMLKRITGFLDHWQIERLKQVIIDVEHGNK